MGLRLTLALGFIAAGLRLASAGEPPSCKPVEHYGVKGCELLEGQTCPAGYHKQAVNPPNAAMMGPTYLMCVPDQKPPQEQKKRQKSASDKEK